MTTNLRPLCATCHKNVRAINYIRKGSVHYRSDCVECLKAKQLAKSSETQAFIKSGYKKKIVCDRCNFKAKYSSQISIVFLDGNKMNTSRQNLRSFCANCIAEMTAAPMNFRCDLIADF